MNKFRIVFLSLGYVFISNTALAADFDFNCAIGDGFKSNISKPSKCITSLQQTEGCIGEVTDLVRGYKVRATLQQYGMDSAHQPGLYAFVTDSITGNNVATFALITEAYLMDALLTSSSGLYLIGGEEGFYFDVRCKR